MRIPPALVLAWCTAVAACGTTGEAVPLSGPLPPWRPGDRFLAVGDLQRTGGIEVWRRRNDAERERIVARIAEARPAFLVSLGDLVFHGASERRWARLDRLLAPVRDAGIPVFPVLGNHEYWGENDRALANFRARFPDLRGRRFYALRWGPVGLVFLDGNVAELSPAEWEEERAWFAAGLAELDADPAVRGVLVFVHRPPFTNGAVTGDGRRVEEAFVPAFLAAQKTLALVSGHVHAYERFAREGRTFLVSGGGGGPRARLLTGDRRRHPDDLYPGPALRDFHYLSFRPGEAGIEVVVTGLPEGGVDFHEMERFSLPWR